MRFCVSKGFHLCSLQQPADVPEPRHYVQALLPWLCFPRSPWLRIMAINEVSTFKYCRKLFQFLPATGWVAQSCCVPVPVFLWPVQRSGVSFFIAHLVLFDEAISKRKEGWSGTWTYAPAALQGWLLLCCWWDSVWLYLCLTEFLTASSHFFSFAGSLKYFWSSFGLLFCCCSF